MNNIELPKKFQIIIIIMINVFIALITWRIWDSSSYWIDELYSVAATKFTLDELFNEVIMRDVHPPLYQLVLHWWVSIFSDSEFSTRSLSVFFTLAALFSFSKFIYERENKKFAYIAFAFYVSSGLLPFYAQEARSYTMALFFSTFLTAFGLKFLVKNENKLSDVTIIIFAAIFLSLTHFFGLIYSGLVLAILAIDKSLILKNRVIFLVSGLFLLIWPIFHFINGDLSNFVGGNFWIKSYGPHQTLSTFIAGVLPQFELIIRYAPLNLGFYIVSFVCIVLVVMLARIYVFQALKNNINLKSGDAESIKITRFVFFLILSLLISVSIIDFFSPISTPINHLIFLPVFALAVSCIIVNSKLSFFKINFVVFLFVISGFIIAGKILKQKHYPLQNYSDAVSFIIKNNLLEERDLFFVISNGDQDSAHSRKMVKFYFERHGLKYLDVKHMPLGSINKFNKESKFVYLIMHSPINVKNLVDNFESIGFNVSIYQPLEHYKGSAIVIYTN